MTARAAAAEAVGLARRRYLAGEDDLTVLLQTQASFSAADRLSIQALAAELQQLTALYKALGGGWEGCRLVNVAMPKATAAVASSPL